MDQQQKLASLAHERLMLNLAVFHLLLPVAALSTGYVLEILVISLVGTMFMLTWIYLQNRQLSVQNDWVAAHWTLAWHRCRWLLIAYAISCGILAIGFVLGQMQSDHNMASIFLVIFSRIAVVPTILMVLVLFVLETTSLSEARQGMAPA